MSSRSTARSRSVVSASAASSTTSSPSDEEACHRRVDHGDRAGEDLSGRSVDGELVALGDRPSSRSRRSARGASTCSSSAPQTQVLPIPRATTAAWDVLPPREVRIPAAAIMPSQVVGVRLPAYQQHLLTARRPLDRGGRVEDDPTRCCSRGRGHPGGEPLTRRAPHRTGGTSAGPSCLPLTRLSASSRVISSSSISWVAMRNAAAAVRLPTRVCSIQSLPRSMVNSMSHRSR